MAMKKSRLILFAAICIQLVFAGAVFPQISVAVQTLDDFEDGSLEGWSFGDPSNWEVANGILQQKNSVGTSGDWLQYYAVMDGGGSDSAGVYLEGDFILKFKVGFNENAYPMENPTTIAGSVWQRSMAVGVMKDSRNAVLANFYRSNGKQNGIVKITDGSVESIDHSNDIFTGQGMGSDIHDIREITFECNRACRNSKCSNIITVRLDGKIVYQGGFQPEELTGYPVICSRGPVGLALDKLDGNLEDAPTPPVWTGPIANRHFWFCMSDRDIYKLYPLSIEGTATIEGDTREEGAFMGWWTQDGFRENNWSWAAAGGQLTIQNWTMAENATLETWFKIPEWPSDVTSVPLFHLMFDGSRINEEWGRERGGPVIYYLNGKLTLDFHEFGWTNEAPVGIEGLTFDEWHHFAWVREGEHHYFYLDFEEAAAFDIPRYGATELTGMQINMANNADHDWVRRIGTPLLMIDRVAGIDEALAPDDFLLISGNYVVYGTQLATSLAPSCDFNEDGNINISDVIALLLFQRNNPGDLGGDYEQNGKADITDAIAMLMDIRDGNCTSPIIDGTVHEGCW